MRMRSSLLVLIPGLLLVGLVAGQAKYGDDSSNVDSTLVNSIFGLNQVGIQDSKKTKNTGAPKEVVVDEKYSNCSYYQQDGYFCVPYYQCADGIIITDGEGIINIRSSLLSVELDPDNSKCASYLEVCCRDPDWEGVPLTVGAELTSTQAPLSSSPKPDPKTPRPHTYQPRCGRRNVNGIGVRIQNDKYEASTQFGEWPHMCAILNKGVVDDQEVNLFVCGGSLIAPDILLTAAHCVNELIPSNIKVRCGEWDTQQLIEPVDHQDRYAKHVVIHPEFNPTNVQNDFAIIHLQQPFDLNSHIDTICLPNQFEGPYSYLTQDCAATGWGKDHYGAEGEYQVILKQVQMDLVEEYECQERLRKTGLGSRFKLHDSFICAGGVPGKDTCKGDGGGPLVCPTKPGASPSEQTYVQAGIVAWGIECGTSAPGVYANVSASLCFIDWATRCHKGIEVDYYGYYGCARWAKKTYCDFKTKIYDYSLQLEQLTDLKAKGHLFRERARLEALLPEYAAAAAGCSNDFVDVDCDIHDYDGEADISSIAILKTQGVDEDSDKTTKTETGPRIAPDSTESKEDEESDEDSTDSKEDEESDTRSDDVPE